ncbi:MAG: sigma-70 family RNA polymerase sigma factor [Isosphaeraceae bacterium]|nr:sigma-70 family RNA polymerase sigma factor [Isosphaeraceae bacterium]
MDDHTAGSMTILIDDLASPESDIRDEAARRIWERYGPRLLNLVRDRIDRRLHARIDAEDVAQSAYLSFCARQDPERPLGDRVELWRFLAHIAVRKVCNAANHHRATMRDYRREAAAIDVLQTRGLDFGIPEPCDGTATEPDGAAVVAEMIDSLPTEELRRIALWRLEGRSNSEIAKLIGRTVRSVEIKLQRIRACLSVHSID